LNRAGINFHRNKGYHLTLKLSRVGYGGHTKPVQPGFLTKNGNSINIEHGNLTEWYRCGKFFVEQGVTLAAPPTPSAPGQPLQLRYEWTGNLAAAWGKDGSIEFRDMADVTYVRYSNLHATDKSGHLLPARMVLHSGYIDLLIADNDAAYPIQIDPLFSVLHKLDQRGTFPLVRGAAYGRAVAMEGRYVAISAPLAGREVREHGSVFLFLHDAESDRWYQGDVVNTQDSATGNHYGAAIAMDGYNLVIGAPGVDAANANDTGAVYLRVRNESDNSHAEHYLPAARLVINYPVGGEHLGRSVAIDGDVIVAGAAGAAYAFTHEKGGTFSSQLFQRLVPANDTAEISFGVAVSVDNDIILVGSPSVAGGKVYVFTADVNGTFSHSGTLMAPAGASRFGAAVALGNDVALIGAPGTDGMGAVYVYSLSERNFSRGAVLRPPSRVGGAGFGKSVDIDDGRAIIGAPGIDQAFVYEGLSGDGELSLLKNLSGYRSMHHFGVDVAIDGNLGVIGADQFFGPGSAENRPGSAVAVESDVDLSVALRPDKNYAPPGGEVTYIVNVTNHDPHLQAHHVTLTDQLRRGGTFQSASVDCRPHNNRLICDLGTLDPGMSREPAITITVTDSASEKLETVVWAYAVEGDQNDDNNKVRLDLDITDEPPPSDPPDPRRPPPSPPATSEGGGGSFGLVWLVFLGGKLFQKRRYWSCKGA
jgi:uncharacterized repeat protein (TIGR01451 family)